MDDLSDYELKLERQGFTDRERDQTDIPAIAVDPNHDDSAMRKMSRDRETKCRKAAGGEAQRKGTARAAQHADPWRQLPRPALAKARILLEADSSEASGGRSGSQMAAANGHRKAVQTSRQTTVRMSDPSKSGVGANARGSHNSTVVPRPSWLVSRSAPPAWVTRVWAMDRPRPVPLPTGLVVKKGSTARVKVTASMPVPVSPTVTAT
jgi:hypothetical protein